MAARRLTPAFLLLVLALITPAAAAQQATPEISAGPLDLAAMALAPEDVPAGYFDDYGELAFPAGAAADLVLGGPAPAGLERLYQTYYFAPEQGMGITVSLLAFASPAAAADGAGVVGALLRPPLPEGTTIGPESALGPDIGDEQSTVTTVTYDTRAAGGPHVAVAAVSFRHGRILAVLAAERWTDPPEDGTPIAEGATPAAVDSALEGLAGEHAAVLEQRITAVLAGTAPAGVDFALSEALLPLEQLVDASTPVLGGYKSGIDLLRCGICGEENSLVPFADAARTGVARGVAVGPLVDGEPTPPFVSIAITAFASADDALAVLDAIRQAPNDRPTAITLPRGAKTLVDDPEIPGATAALAFSAVLDEQNPDASADSAGVDFVVGDRLVTVDVQGGLSADAALAAAVDLATQQATCLTSGGPCARVQAPAALSAGS
jgi:hypothetical protein